VRQRNLCLAWFVLHFLLIIIASCRDLFRLVADGLTILPSSFSIAAQRVETIASRALSQNLPDSNLFRRGLITYLHIAGIERGYGYFAPNIPGGYKLVFELHFADGRVEYMVKTLAASVWREHPGVIKIRAVFGSLNLPRAEEFERGKRESYDFLYAYDFSRAEEPAKAENH
jgi:hypothetical protein